MAATSKKLITEKLEQWGRLAQRQKQIVEKRDRELQPHKEQYEAACAAIVDAADEKLRPLQNQMATLAGELEVELLAGVKPDGTIAIPQLAVDAAIAQVIPTPTREISPQDLLKEIPAPDRNPAFWSSLKVMLGETTKLIGAKRVAELATTMYGYKVEIRLK